MKLNTRTYVNSFIISIFLLIMTVSLCTEVFANSHRISYSSSSFIKDDEDKNIMNVKTSYNPVAEQITVSLKLGKQSNVVIKLMDALGNEILNLSNSTLESGVHNLSFETEGKVSVGIYFIRVSSGSETVVKRISIR